MNSISCYVDDGAIENIDSLDQTLCDNWSPTGELWSPCDRKYAEKTTVECGDDAIQAFRHYTDYFTHILADWEPVSDRLVLLPCGSSKPIGSSSIHQKKLAALKQTKLKSADIVALSEPCVVVPQEYRLSLPAVNYDFPPKYTERGEYNDVFDIFTNRLSDWLAVTEYDEIYPYLISGHQNKFDAAVEISNISASIVNIPGSSYNPSSDSYAGDMFKTREQIMYKIRSVLKYKTPLSIIDDIPESHDEFYSDKF